VWKSSIETNRKHWNLKGIWYLITLDIIIFHIYVRAHLSMGYVNEHTIIKLSKNVLICYHYILIRTRNMQYVFYFVNRDFLRQNPDSCLGVYTKFSIAKIMLVVLLWSTLLNRRNFVSLRYPYIGSIASKYLWIWSRILPDSGKFVKEKTYLHFSNALKLWYIIGQWTLGQNRSLKTQMLQSTWINDILFLMYGLLL
jgi:hypothetical protein